MKPVIRAALLSALVAITAACKAENNTNKAPAAPTASQTSTAASVMKVENPYARAVPPGQANSGAFMTFVNTGDTDHSVKSASSTVANSVELHTHTNNNGVMEMRQIPQIDVPAKGRVELAPGGLHVMFLGLKQDLKAGETVAITLTFDDGSTTTVNAPIKEVTPPAAMQHGMQAH